MHLDTLVLTCGALYLPHYKNLDPKRNFQELLIIILAHTMTPECLIVHAMYTF